MLNSLKDTVKQTPSMQTLAPIFISSENLEGILTEIFVKFSDFVTLETVPVPSTIPVNTIPYSSIYFFRYIFNILAIIFREPAKSCSISGSLTTFTFRPLSNSFSSNSEQVNNL